MNSNCSSRRVCAAFAMRSILGITALSALAACNGQSSSDAFTGTTAAASPVAVATAPTVSLQANESSVTMGASVTLQWKASNAETCTASGGWSGTVPTTGTMTTPPLTAGTSYTLACTGSGGTATQSVDVVVGPPANAIRDTDSRAYDGEQRRQFHAHLEFCWSDRLYGLGRLARQRGHQRELAHRHPHEHH